MKKTICLTLSLVFIFLSFTGCNNKDLKEEIENINNKTFENIVLDKDLVEISERNGIVKIDSITAGLDSYSFDTILFDVKNEKILCNVSFSEGAWVSDLTENGFYVVDTIKKQIRIYDNHGNIAKEFNLSYITEPINFCTLSENEKYFLYSIPSGTQVNVINISDNSKSVIDIMAPLNETLSFKDTILRAVSIDGQVFELDIAKSGCRLSLVDNRINLFSDNYCLGETETNFMLLNEDECSYIPISSADEVVIQLWKNGFITTSVFDNKYMHRFYDLKEKNISFHYTTEPIEKICYIENKKVLAVVGSSMEKQHKIISFTLNPSEKLTVLSEDISIKTEENISAQEVTQIPKKLIENVPIISQFPKYPTGCESVTAVMALNYYGKSISVEEFINNYLPKSRDFYIENGKNFGPSPYEYFIGNPKSSSSYGCMAPVIEKAINKFINNSGKVKNITDMSLDSICEEYIDNNIPVIMWVTINMLETNPKHSWYLNEETRFTWPGNEHCMLLIGYDNKNYYFNDPYTGKLVAYKKLLTEDRFAELGRQALVILPQ